MAARSVVIASVAAPVVRRVIPGRALPEGVTPESEGSILAWLQSHVGLAFDDIHTFVKSKALN